MYIYEIKDWPRFEWDEAAIALPLSGLRNKQGRIMGRMEAMGFVLQEEAKLRILSADVLKSTEIEGEFLDPQQVRSSVARRLGLDIAALVPSDRHVDGVVAMMLDATQNYEATLSKERLFGWHTTLFPDARSGNYSIETGSWRSGPMQVVSGPLGRERVHFEAPAAAALEKEMQAFLLWFNSNQHKDPVLKAALAQLWFVTVHPFDDGNGRIARAIADMQLARSDGSRQRFYSMSAQISKEHNKYYEMLEKTQKGALDITEWLLWFFACMDRALDASTQILGEVIQKAQFWEQHGGSQLNERQRLMLNKLMDGFEGKLTTSKWAKIAKCSQDTALRDILDLVGKNILQKEESGGRSTSYGLRSLATGV